MQAAAAQMALQLPILLQEGKETDETPTIKLPPDTK